MQHITTVKANLNRENAFSKVLPGDLYHEGLYLQFLDNFFSNATCKPSGEVYLLLRGRTLQTVIWVFYKCKQTSLCQVSHAVHSRVLQWSSSSLV